MTTKQQGIYAAKFTESAIHKMKPLQEVNNVNMAVQQLGENKQFVNDGYHSFKELYDFRLVYNATLFNEWANNILLTHISTSQDTSEYRPLYNVHKSWKHFDGELAFGGGWFIVSAMLPSGLISNHYEAIHWDLFKIPEVEKALYKFDEHTPQYVLTRLKEL